MKLTKATLKKIIKEEYSKAVTENEEWRSQEGGDYFAPEGEYDEQKTAKKQQNFHHQAQHFWREA